MRMPKDVSYLYFVLLGYLYQVYKLNQPLQVVLVYSMTLFYSIKSNKQH